MIAQAALACTATRVPPKLPTAFAADVALRAQEAGLPTTHAHYEIIESLPAKRSLTVSFAVNGSVATRSWTRHDLSPPRMYTHGPWLPCTCVDLSPLIPMVPALPSLENATLVGTAPCGTAGGASSDESCEEWRVRGALLPGDALAVFVLRGSSTPRMTVWTTPTRELNETKIYSHFAAGEPNASDFVLPAACASATCSEQAAAPNEPTPPVLRPTDAPPVLRPTDAPPVPPPVPLAYSQRFRMSDGSSGTLNYDYRHRRQRISHYNNTAHRTNQCFFWFGSTAPCVEYFVGGRQYVHFPEDGSCCLESCDEVCAPGVNVSDGSCCRELGLGPPRPDAVSKCTFNGTVAAHTTGDPVDWYQCPACLNYYFSPFSAGRPQQMLSFWTENLLYEVDFDVASLRVEPQPGELFKLPAACQPDAKCKGFVASPKLVC